MEDQETEVLIKRLRSASPSAAFAGYVVVVSLDKGKSMVLQL